MGCFVRPYRNGGWLTTQGARLRGRQLSERLKERIKGRGGLFLTLTVKDDGGGIEEAYDEVQRNKGVSRFFKELSDRTGVNFAGRWICKLEFTKKGMLHFHILIMDVRYIAHAVIEECWGRGFVWVNQFYPDRSDGVSAYFSKSTCSYVGKALHIPHWVRQRPVGSIKVVRTSPGFWPKKRVFSKKGDCQVAQESCPKTGLPIYVPIGHQIVQSNSRCTLEDTTSNRKASFEDLSVGAVAVYLKRDGHSFEVLGQSIVTTASFEETLEAAAAAARRRRPIHLNKLLNRAWTLEALSC